MTQIVRTSRQVAELKPSPDLAETLRVDADRLMTRLGDHARSMSKTQIALEAFRDSRSEDAPRARPARAARLNQEQGKWEQR
jgi:hypothetical protein